MPGTKTSSGDEAMRFFLLCGITLLLPGLAGAQEKKPREKVEPIEVIKIDRQDPVLYEKDIEPILANKCQFCHSGSLKEAKFDMGTFETFTKGGKSGPPIVPGKSAESLIIKTAGRGQKPYMPPLNE